MPPQQLNAKPLPREPPQGENKQGLGMRHSDGQEVTPVSPHREGAPWAEQGHGSGWAQARKKCPLELFCSCCQSLKVFQMPLNG